ncbi:choice-of-anchor A family protein [Hyalangium versicolor]|uniref:choice-of-anchor A family protein n=1 Tax=Hyalangium versicolor TaxID=2861190 RepID=UPI00272CE99D|nr:choice-of-anchor A family protein [Hyalangium versicolor]
MQPRSSALSVTAASCGDGNRSADEQCDDGNTQNGDGCSSVCTVENGYLCTDAGFSLAFTEQWFVSGAVNPNWQLSADRLTVRQTTNSAPAVYMTNLPVGGAPLSFELAVETNSDDDFIGWVVGFDSGDTTNPQAEYMLFDWKQGDQDLGGGVMGLAGLAMSRVKGAVDAPKSGQVPFWEHSGAISEVARALHLGRTGWADRAVYRVKMDYSTSRIRVWVNDVLEFDQTGTFPAGRFGFYTLSQENDRFTLVSPVTGSICGLDPDADPDGDGVRTGDDPAPFDPSICGDANNDGVDDCAPTCVQVHLNDYNLFLLEDYNQGTDVQGKVAAGGNITMNHFSVGQGLPASDVANVLVAGGALTLSNGAVWGDARYGGNYSAGQDVTYVRGSASQGAPIDFATRGAELRQLSTRLASLTANGTTTRESWGGVMLRGTSPGVNVFEVPASALTGAKLLSIDAPAGSLAVINIRGASATFTGFGSSFSGGIDQHGVLYNFVDTTAISARGYGFWGTVLAPYAHVNFTDGSFDGGLYARSMTGNAEGHLNALYDREVCP